MQCEFTKIQVSGVVVTSVYHVLVSVPSEHQRLNLAKRTKIRYAPDSIHSDKKDSGINASVLVD